MRIFILPLLLTLFLPLSSSLYAEGGGLQPNDMANKLGMLSQRILKSYVQIGLNVQYGTPEADLAESTADFAYYLKQLKAASPGGEAAEILTRIETLWAAYANHAEAEPNPEQARIMFSMGQAIVAMSGELFELYEESAGEEHSREMDVVGKLELLSQQVAMLYMVRVWAILEVDELLETATDELNSSLLWLQKQPRRSKDVDTLLSDGLRTIKLLKTTFGIKGEDLSFTVTATTERILKITASITAFYLQR